MNVRKILYALPPRLTARIIAFVTALSLTITGLRVTQGLTENEENDKYGETETENTATDQNTENGNNKPENSAFSTEDAIRVGTVISGTSALLCNLNESKVIAEKGIKDDIIMLDISIFMTAIVSAKAINDGKINLTDFAVCPASAAKIEGYRLSSDVLPIGKRMKISDLIRCMFYQRGSSYAYTLAVHVSGSEEAFVSEMNAEAERLCLNGTVFTSCTGNEAQAAITTVYDTAVILKELLSIPYLREMFLSSEHIEITQSQSSSVKLVVTNDFFESYCTESQARLDGILGGKVSGDGNQGWSVVLFNDGENEYMSIIIGSNSPFSDALMLYSAYSLCYDGL